VNPVVEYTGAVIIANCYLRETCLIPLIGYGITGCTSYYSTAYLRYTFTESTGNFNNSGTAPFFETPVNIDLNNNTYNY
jgi:hypothetical protein